LAGHAAAAARMDHVGVTPTAGHTEAVATACLAAETGSGAGEGHWQAQQPQRRRRGGGPRGGSHERGEDKAKSSSSHAARTGHREAATSVG
jgi:hypothetical protein